MAKKNKGKLNQSASEGKKEDVLKPTPKIKKTPILKKADAKDPEVKSVPEKVPATKTKEKKSVEETAVKDTIKGKDGKKSAMQKDKKENQKDKNMDSRIDKTKDNIVDKRDAKTKEKNLPARSTNTKLGGLIFMCNAKTKPDCFKYMVMGLPESRKELVMSVKPGLKLFLYDYDLKLLYGIYKATCSGGMKLVREAFGGSYSAQVRFQVERDCAPLPISELKHALKEIFDARRNMFKVDLSVQQAQTLVSLFSIPPKPKESIIQPFHIPSVPFVPPAPTLSVQGPPVLVHPGHVPEVGLQRPRESASREGLPLTEKDYRIHGLLPPQRTAPAVVPSAVPTSHVSGLDVQHERRDAYYSHSYDTAAILDSRTSYRGDLTSHRLPYSDSGRAYDSGRSYYGRELEHGACILERPVAYESDSLHSKYGATALPDYGRRQQQPGSSLESVPVSSRYAFAGPSLTFR